LHPSLGSIKQIAKSSSAQISFDQHEFRVGDNRLGDLYSSTGWTSQTNKLLVIKDHPISLNP